MKRRMVQVIAVVGMLMLTLTGSIKEEVRAKEVTVKVVVAEETRSEERLICVLPIQRSIIRTLIKSTSGMLKR